MKIIDNDHGTVTVNLEATDCFRLAQALRLAEVASQEQSREDLGQLWSTSAALFEALGMISVVQRHIPGKYEQVMSFHETFNLPTVQADVMYDLEDFRPESEKAA